VIKLPKEKRNFDPNYSNEKGQSYLHFFAFDGDLSGISVLSAAGADPNKKDRYGMTPLHYAALNGQRMAILELIHVGARKDIKDNDGDCPADIARKKARDDLLGILTP
jgi:ankyrin repeat protein